LTLLEISKYFAEWSVAALLTTFSITSILTGVYLVRNGLCEDHITIGRIDGEGACRFSADGSSLPFMVVGLGDPHHLPLNGSPIRQPPTCGSPSPRSPEASSNSHRRRRLHGSPPRPAHRIHPLLKKVDRRKLYKYCLSMDIGKYERYE